MSPDSVLHMLCLLYTSGNWLEVWYENYAKIKMRPSTYLTYHGYIENHIKPQLGKIPLNDLTTCLLYTSRGG